MRADAQVLNQIFKHLRVAREVDVLKVKLSDTGFNFKLFQGICQVNLVACFDLAKSQLFKTINQKLI